VTDPVDAMLAAARRLFEEVGVHNAEFMPVTAEHLPFPDGSFEIVTTRLAAHHFDDVPQAMHEIARVLRPGGRLIFVDTTAPLDTEAARFQDDVERLRDSTHRQLHTQAQWASFAEDAGLRVERVEVVRKAHPFEAWLQRGGEDAQTMELVRERFLHAPERAVRALEITTANGMVTSFTDSKLVFAARK
jgi:ubiquinone/menaquinone biosynthesis C-methylase UbiE